MPEYPHIQLQAAHVLLSQSGRLSQHTEGVAAWVNIFSVAGAFCIVASPMQHAMHADCANSHNITREYVHVKPEAT